MTTTGCGAACGACGSGIDIDIELGGLTTGRGRSVGTTSGICVGTGVFVIIGVFVIVALGAAVGIDGASLHHARGGGAVGVGVKVGVPVWRAI